MALLGEAQAEAEARLSVEQLALHTASVELVGDGGDPEAVSLPYDALRQLNLQTAEEHGLAQPMGADLQRDRYLFYASVRLAVRHQFEQTCHTEYRAKVQPL